MDTPLQVTLQRFGVVGCEGQKPQTRNSSSKPDCGHDQEVAKSVQLIRINQLIRHDWLRIVPAVY